MDGLEVIDTASPSAAASPERRLEVGLLRETDGGNSRDQVGV